MWCYREDTSKFSIYKSCHAIASKRFMAFEDFPISDDCMDYMPNHDFFAYIGEYVTGNKLINCQGLYLVVCVERPALWVAIRFFKSVVNPMYRFSGNVSL